MGVIVTEVKYIDLGTIQDMHPSRMIEPAIMLTTPTLILLLFTLFPRSKTTLLPLDFEHFSPNIDNFAPIQK